MSERPLNLKVPSVQAFLAGRKTQHRVSLQPQPVGELHRYEDPDGD